LWVVSDYIFGTFKILTRVTINIKELITRVTSDRVYSIMEWIDSIDTELVLGYVILLNAIGILLYMGLSEWVE
jgi:hypothetical protein|tara:strand:+ start:354 stop:572 length:219 start_codon:yes stop_codon:yes gene_type:complete